MINLLKQLLEPAAPSGREDAVADVIEKLAAPYGQISRDVLGSVLVHRPGNGKKILCMAHMDSVGFVVNYIDADGFAHITALGSLQPAEALAQRVRFLDGTAGIVSACAGTDLKSLTMDQLYIDTAGQPVRVGDTAVYAAGLEQTGEMILAPFLGSRLSCAILLKTLQQCQGSENDLYFAFVVQEEMGARGAGPVAFTVAPELGIFVCADTAGTVPDSSLQPLKTGGGPVLKYMDGTTISDPAACLLVEQAADSLGICLQAGVSPSGITGAYSMQTVLRGAAVTQLAFAARYLHTPGEIAHLGDAEQCAQLLTEVLRR